MAGRYRFRFKQMDVYRAAVEHFQWVGRVVQRMPKGPWKVIDQVVGSSLSIMGNIGEANGRDPKPGEVEQHYRYAQGSTYEAATHLDALRSLGVIDDDEYTAAEDRLARIAAMLTSLMQRQRRKAQGAQRPKKRAARPGKQSKPSNDTQRRPSTPRVSGVPEGPQGPTGIDPERSEAPTAAQRPGVDPRAAGPRGSAATEGDRPSPRANRERAVTEGDRPS